MRRLSHLSGHLEPLPLCDVAKVPPYDALGVAASYCSFRVRGSVARASPFRRTKKV
jgi:hypothetical protein